MALIDAGILLPVLLIGEVPAADRDNVSVSIDTHGTVWNLRAGTQPQRVIRPP